MTMDWDDYRTKAAATLLAVRQGDITIADAWHRIDRLREGTSDTETENYLEGVIKEPDVDIHAIDRTIAQLETAASEQEFQDWLYAQPEAVIPSWLRHLMDTAT